MTRDSSETHRTDETAGRRTDTTITGASPTERLVDDFSFPDRLAGLPVLPRPTVARLTKKQLVDYKTHRERLLTWMLTRGKNPKKGQGYAYDTVRCRAYNTDIFYRWVWDDRGYTTQVTTDDADAYLDALVREDQTASNKQNIEKAVKMLFRWRAYEFGEDVEAWAPAVSFAAADGPREPPDYLSRPERTAIREAALEYGSVPHYNALDPAGRREWKRYLAHRYRKPMADIGKADFERANGYKIPSLVCTSLDAGLRPKEVATAHVGWVDTENALLRIPYGESVKNDGNWHVSLRRETAEYLRRWLEERQLYDKYQDTDLLWLTRERNPYRSTALKYLLENLCAEAGIDTDNRRMTWYSIRHSVGTYLTREEGMKAAKSQLRHHNIETTGKYDQAPVEDRRDALDRM